MGVEGQRTHAHRKSHVEGDGKTVFGIEFLLTPVRLYSHTHTRALAHI